jgi:hypothetical protein
MEMMKKSMKKPRTLRGGKQSEGIALSWRPDLEIRYMCGLKTL